MFEDGAYEMDDDASRYSIGNQIYTPVYQNGQTADVPEGLARQWIEYGWASASDGEPEPAPQADDQPASKAPSGEPSSQRVRPRRRDPRVRPKAKGDDDGDE